MLEFSLRYTESCSYVLKKYCYNILKVTILTHSFFDGHHEGSEALSSRFSTRDSRSRARLSPLRAFGVWGVGFQGFGLEVSDAGLRTSGFA